MQKIKEYAFVFLLGGGMYCTLEVLWRGYTHWSMGLCGGVCFAIIYLVSSTDMPYIVKGIVGAAAITAVEFAAGFIVNIELKMNVWDYTPEPYNIMGQICPLYSFFWLLLCLAAVPLCRKLRGRILTFSQG